MDYSNEICPVCHQATLPEYYFCPNCGASLKEKIKEISVLAKWGLYALALFLPPFGFYPGIKYLMKKDQKTRQLGIIIVVLTTISCILTIWSIFSVFNTYLNQFNTILD